MSIFDFLFSSRLKAMKRRIERLEARLLELAPEREQDGDARIRASRIFSVGDILEKISLGITRSHSGLAGDVDVTVLTLPALLKRLAEAARLADRRLCFYDTDGEWRDFEGEDTTFRPQETARSGCIELAIADRDDRLESRYSIARWSSRDSSLYCHNPKAPIKRVSMARARRGYGEAERATETEPIDAVYCWVNSEDPEWRASLSEFRPDGDIDKDRFQQFDEMKFSIRSIDMFAPWIRKIFVFSDCRPPDWFRAGDRVEWVYHKDVIDKAYLPLFNSHAIETFLHEIPGLSDRFLYFNDDMFLSGFVRPSDFFTDFGQGVSRLERSGMVPYFLDNPDRCEEWQAATANSARLLLRDDGVLPARLHKHTNYALKISAYRKLVETYGQEIEATRRSRFRAASDHNFTAFLYHHFCLARGEAVESNEEAIVVRAHNFRTFIKEELYKKVRFFCVNDGRGSASDADYVKFKREFLPKIFPFKSRAEK